MMDTIPKFSIYFTDRSVYGLKVAQVHNDGENWLGMNHFLSLWFVQKLMYFY